MKHGIFQSFPWVPPNFWRDPDVELALGHRLRRFRQAVNFSTRHFPSKWKERWFLAEDALMCDQKLPLTCLKIVYTMVCHLNGIFDRDSDDKEQQFLRPSTLANPWWMRMLRMIDNYHLNIDGYFGCGWPMSVPQEPSAAVGSLHSVALRYALKEWWAVLCGLKAWDTIWMVKLRWKGG